MVALFVYAVRIAARADDPDLRRSAWAGFWAGLVILVLYIVSQSSRMRGPDLDISTLPGLQPAPLLIGLTAGFVFLWMVRFLVPTRVVGLVTLLLSATSTCALFSYVFIDSLRLSVLYASLGAALGILLHIVVFPASLKGTSD
jgi:hypothetical protein